MIASINELLHLVRDAGRIVAFTGAGISTESGIPDFRSPGGVWATSQPVYFDQFLRSPEARLEYWRQKSEGHDAIAAAQPNVAHRTIARWEEQGRSLGVITQNIDGLHQLAGSRTVWELHGTAREVGCLDCGARYDAGEMVQQFREDGRVPICPECGGKLKHATVSFGQQLPSDVLEEAAAAAESADVFLAIGSSLVVHPAAGLPVIAKRAGARLVIVNRDETPLDDIADVVVNAPIGETFERIAGASEDRPA